MGRKSTIVRLAAPVKSAIDTACKDNRLTLDELLAYLREQYPQDALPSRSALGRYKHNFDEITKSMRETREIADIWAQRLGDAPESDIGKVVLEILRTLSYRVGADLMAPGADVDARTLGQLAKAMEYIENAGRMGLAREQALTKAAREVAATAALKVAKRKGVSIETQDLIRREILGLTQ